ncbi:MAG: nickel pincer cofactor biosynthesis protein LarB [Candidatus Omnitrophica bacterium]|nr:nickel pincer cofactor biosynthesis protein LarB [Candidatus Omnitrophota bacterium]
MARLRDLPFQDLRFAKVDLHRPFRRNFAEVIYARGKTPAQVVAIARVLRRNGHPVLITKLNRRMASKIRKRLPGLRYFPEAQLAAGASGGAATRPGAAAGPFPSLRGPASGRSGEKSVLVMTAGTSDIPVAEEAAVTLECLGVSVRRLFDVGVAGLPRLLAHRKLLWDARVIVVVAGMDGVLPSVVSGLVGRPVIAVPTSVGYGASFEGVAPLLTMLNSCSPGVAVVNIDNGFGAGYLAATMLDG